MHHRSARSRLPVVVPLALLTALLLILALGSPSGAADRTTGSAGADPTTPPVTTAQPNIVVVLTDDQRRDSMRYMPNVQRLLVDQGTRYTQAMVPTSLCCPSRATILSGRYAHTSKVWGNGDVGGVKKGGWPRFYATGTESRTIATRLRDAGYQTALVGKYLNFFGKYATPGYVPPGWDTFYTLMSNHGAYYNYRTNDGVFHGTAPEDYSTDVFAAKAVETIRSSPVDRPLFLYFATYGPHSPFAPAPRHDGAMAGLLPDYTAPTLDQPLKSMPRWMRERVHVDKATADWTRLKQHEALLSVDEAVGRIHDALAETGRDGNTLFLFMSDNGYFWGEHRITGKDAPYKDATYIPMVARWDGHVPAGVTSSRIVLNVDVAKTLATAAGTTMRSDGLDMFGDTTRKGFVLEAMRGYHDRPAYCGWRTKNRMFVRWATGERELYDYRSDPAEAHNLAYTKSWAEVRDTMRRQAVKHCSPEPPAFSW